MELLQKWMEIATEEGDKDTQLRLLELMKNETERAEIHLRWQQGDDDYLVDKVIPKPKRIPASNGNGKH